MPSLTDLLEREPETETQGIFVRFWVTAVIAALIAIIVGLIILASVLGDDEFPGRQTDTPQSVTLSHDGQALYQPAVARQGGEITVESAESSRPVLPPPHALR